MKHHRGDAGRVPRHNVVEGQDYRYTLQTYPCSRNPGRLNTLSIILGSMNSSPACVGRAAGRCCHRHSVK